MKLNKEEKITQ